MFKGGREYIDRQTAAETVVKVVFLCRFQKLNKIVQNVLRLNVANTISSGVNTFA